MAQSRDGRKKWLAALVVLLIGLSLYFGRSRGRVETKLPLIDGSTATIVKGVHLIGGLGPAAAYAIETQDGIVLIDSGLEEDARTLKSEMEKSGLDWRKVRAIFLTHVHGDHCGGAQQLRAETGARVYAGQAEIPVLNAGTPREAFYSTFKMPGHSPHATTVDIALQGGETMNFGDVSIQVLDTPGHTYGSTCYLMERSRLRVLFSGDVIMRYGEKPLGTYSAYLSPRYRGDARAFQKSLEKLRALPSPDVLLPGHPRANGGWHLPRLTQSQWERTLDDGIHEMQRLVAQHETDGANFLDGNPKSLLPNLYYLGEFHGTAVYGFFASSRFFVSGTPDGADFCDFLKAKLSELNLKPAEPFALLLTGCGERQTAGLKEFVDRTSAIVVVSAAGLPTIRKICSAPTTIVSAEQVNEQGWFPVTTIPLAGPATEPVCYLLQWDNKKVLISGRFPNFFDEQLREELDSDPTKSKPYAMEAIQSLRKLAPAQPDLLLPAVPVDDQNANLYEGNWNSILEKSFRSANEMLQR